MLTNAKLNPNSWQANRARRAIASAIAKQIAVNLPADKVEKVAKAQYAFDDANQTLRDAINDAARIN